MRIGLAAVVGGIVLFAWGFLSWAIMPYMVSAWHPSGELANEDAVRQSLVENINDAGNTERAVYWIPNWPSPDAPEGAQEAWEQKHAEGPIALLVYNPDGRDPNDMLAPMLRGFGINVLSALVAALLLSSAALSGYMKRVAFVTCLGLLIGIVSNGMQWNWFGFPTDWSITGFADNIIAWLLAGLVLAAFVKGKHTETA